MTRETAAGAMIGLIAAPGDHAAELAGEVETVCGRELVLVHRPEAQTTATLDSWLVASQAELLRHAPALLADGRPVRVILRRAMAAEPETGWRRGLMLAHALTEQAAPGQIRFFALSRAARRDIGRITGINPELFEPRFGAPPAEAMLRIEPEQGVLRTPEDTCLRAAALNWAKLRRLGRLPASRRRGMAPDDEDIRSFGWAATADLPARPAAAPRLVMVVPNGIGLGHVTRLLAIADAIRVEAPDADIAFWSFSRAAELIAAAGYDVILRQTAAHIGADPVAWRAWESAEFGAFLRRFRPDAVLNDAGQIDGFLHGALRQPGNGGVALVWIRRAMWQEGADAGPLEDAQFCDLILEPGDLSFATDRGPTVADNAVFKGFSQFLRTPPVMLEAGNATLPRREARKQLGLPWRRPVCLVSLGGDAFTGREIATGQITEAARQAGVQLYWVRSPLAGLPSSGADGIAFHRLYPLGRYLAGFDGIVTAAGYNSFHEAMLRSTAPVLLCPTLNQRLDDQVARAAHAADQGWAEILHPEAPQDHVAVLARFMAAVRLRAPVAGRPALRPGAPDMARAILQLIRDRQP